MYNFDGQHKAGLKVSLGGVSKKIDKSTLLQSARDERNKREKTRKENGAAVMLQSWIRGCFVRNILSKSYRNEFDCEFIMLQKDLHNMNIRLAGLVQKLCLFYKASEDYQRLVSICQMLLKLSSGKKLNLLMNEDLSSWILKIKTLLVLCCSNLHTLISANITIPLRMIEVFTEAHTYNWLGESKSIKISTDITVNLVLKGYFHHLRELVNKRVPSSIEPSPHPPTPFAAAAKDLFLKPLLLQDKYTTSLASENSRQLVYSTFITDLLSPPMSEQICFFVVPAIASEIPFSSFLQCIATTQQQHTVWTLYSFLHVCECHIENTSPDEIKNIVSALRILIPKLNPRKENGSSATNTYESDSDDSDVEMDAVVTVPDSRCLSYIKEKCMSVLNEKNITTAILNFIKHRQAFSSDDYSRYIRDLCATSHHLLVHIHTPVHRWKLLYSLAFNADFMYSCWSELMALKTKTFSGKDVNLIHQLSHGYTMSREDQSRLLPLLGSFASLFRYALFSIYDSDFYGDTKTTGSRLMPFSLRELVDMSQILRDVVLGLITFMYPDIKSAPATENWQLLCQTVTLLLKQLYSRDSRHRFCPENHWLSTKAAVSQESLNISSFMKQDDDDVQPEEIFKPGMSTINARSLAILRYVPFSVPFMQRIRIFQRILTEDKNGSLNVEQTVLPSHGLNITVNRKYLYQDAYDQLSEDRASDVKKPVRVHMINAQGLNEAGIDGGGVFREFMSQLLKTGFDPSYGFFKTTSQQLLYPNPDVERIQPDYIKHLHFLGRMLGKIIYESMMVELPLADFFLCKLLSKQGADVDIHQLESLDPELYKNLLYLKNYEGDVDDLALNFTVIQSDYGETRVEELKPGGRDICVTNSNRIEYIHLMADYRLNKQIRSHCNAFRAGLADVINIEWLQMFDHRELQILISGAEIPVDMHDLRQNTNYSGSYAGDEAYVNEFWNILYSLTDKQKRQFLKFVTSCSRPPLLGFSELYPQFCIHYGGEEDRLPTASTCMNFLKLPRYKNTELLRARLIYAIEAEAGFELS